MSRNIIKIPSEILTAVNEGTLVLFIGAGFSRLCGLPSWRDLAEKLVDDCVSEHFLDYSDADVIKKGVLDSKQLITIAYQYFLEGGKKERFYQKLRDHLTLQTESKDTEILVNFVKRTRAYVLTTNADSILHKCFENTLIHYDEKKFDECLRISLSSATLIHLHGSVLRDESMVFTAENYLKRYKNNHFIELLSVIFNGNQTVLFIGYGANELELLDFLLLKADANPKEHKRYIINGYFDNELTYQNAMEKYYQTLKIDQISFSKNENNYRELTFVLRDWLDEIESLTNVKAKGHKRLTSLVQTQPSPENLVFFAQYCPKEDPSDYQEYFFGIKQSAYSKEWVLELYRSKSTFFSLDCFLPAIQRENGLLSPAWPAFSTFVDLFTEKYFDDEEMCAVANELVINTVNHLLSNDNLYSNTTVTRYLTKLVFASFKLINLIDVLQYLSKLRLSQSSFATQCIMIIAEQKQILLQCDKRVVIGVVSIILDYYRDHENINSQYAFELFSRAFMNDVSAKYPEFIFDDFIKRLTTYQELYPFGYWSMGSIYLYPNDVLHEEFEYKSELVSWLKASIKYLSRESVRGKFLVPESNSEILARVPVYIATTRFDDVADLFFSQTDNPFNVWSKYADLCFLIQNNANRLSIHQVECFSNWIVNATFGRSQEYAMFIDACKYEAMQLLTRSINSHAISENNQINFRPEFSLFDKFHDRNKHFRIQSEWESDDREIEKSMSTLDFNALSILLSQRESDYTHEKYKYQRALSNVLKQNGDLLKEVLANLRKIPANYFESLISVFKEDRDDIDDNERINSLNKMVDILTAQQNSRNPLVSIIWLLHERGFYKSHASQSYEMCMKATLYAISHPEQSKIDSFQHHPYTSMINNLLYISLDMLFFSAVYFAEVNRIELTAKLNMWLGEEEVESVIKASFGAHFSHLETLCMEWLKINSDRIFDNNRDGIDLSHVCFSLHPSYSDFAYNALENERSIQFTKNIDSKDSDIKAAVEHFIKWYLRRYLMSGDLSPHFRLVMMQADSSVLSSLFHYLSDEGLQKEDKVQHTIEIIEKLIIYLESIELFGESPSDQAVRGVCGYITALPKDRDKSLYWRYVSKLAKRFNSYFSDEIITAIETDQTTDKKEILFFLYELAKYSEEWAFHFEIDKIRRVSLIFADDLSLRSEYNKWINKLAEHSKEYFQLIK